MPFRRLGTESVPRQRAMKWLVRAISGISTSACLPCFRACRDRLEIDFGLAGAGDAVEQRHGKAVIARVCEQLARGLACSGVSLARSRVRSRAWQASRAAAR